jgi:phage tail tape measure protein, TP901 family|nr:MAG TPA: minor tail protein [Caudoviricetes sp.]
MTDKIRGITVELSADTAKLSKGLKDANSSINSTQKELKDVNKLLKFDPKNSDLLKQKQDLLKTSIASVKDKLEQEKRILEQLKSEDDGSGKNAEAMRALERDISSTNSELKKLQEQYKEFGSVAQQQIANAGKAVQEAGGKISNAGASLTKNVTAPILAVGAAATASFETIDKGMDIIVEKTGATGDSLEEMQNIAKSVYGQMPSSIEDVGSAVGEVNTRFMYTGDLLEETAIQFLKFAKINKLDVSSSIDSVQKAMDAWSIGADGLTNILDVLNWEGQRTGVSMETLTSGLVNNAPLFKELNMSVDQAADLLATFEVSGFDSSTMLNGLSKAMKNGANDGLSLQESLDKVQEQMLNASTDAEGLSIAYELFGKSGDKVYQAVKDGIIDFNDLAYSVEGADGVLNNVATTFENTQDPSDKMAQKMHQVQTAFAEVGEKLEESILPIAEKLADAIVAILDAWNKLDPGVQAIILTFIGLLAALGPVLSIIGTIVTITGTLGVSFAALAGPIGIAVVAISLLVGVITWIVTHFDELKATAMNVLNAVGDFFKDAWQKITGLFGSIGSWFSDKFNGIKDAASNVWSGITSIFSNAIDFIKGLFNFEFKWPHIPLPHFSFSGSINPLDWLKDGLPKIGVEWYSKAMNRPIMMTGPTIFGMNGNSLLGGGEAGNEVIMSEEYMKKLAGGNTYNFNQINNSPKALTRLEIYRQTRNQFAQLKAVIQ